MQGNTGSLGNTGLSGNTGLQGATGSMSLTAIPASNTLASGITIPLTSDVAVNFGDVCRIAITGNTVIGVADVVADSFAVVMCADTSIGAGASGNFLLHGIARNDSWSWTVGGLIYLSTIGTTGSTMTQTAPSGSNNVIQILGVATNAHRIYFNPQLIQVEHV